MASNVLTKRQGRGYIVLFQALSKMDNSVTSYLLNLEDLDEMKSNRGR